MLTYVVHLNHEEAHNGMAARGPIGEVQKIVPEDWRTDG
jgi:hypothetical protein